MERRLAAILAADVVGYSSQMEIDEAGTLERLKRVFQEVMRPQIKAHKGRVVKLMGDGLLAEFPSIHEAVQCAAGLQAALSATDPQHATDRSIQMRIGVNLGDIIVEGSDIYGEGVNVAARLESLADPGGVCISGPAFDIIDGKLDLTFEDIGEQQVKNISKPVRTYRLVQASAAKSARAKAPGLPASLIRPVVAILPFVEMSDGLKQLEFGDGLTADINRELARLGIVEVIGHQVSRRYNLDVHTVDDIGGALGVGYLLSGSIRRSGDHIRISAELLDVGSGRPIWADRYDRMLKDPLALQDEIARAIAGIVEPSVMREERQRINRSPPEKMKPHELMHVAWKLSDEGTRKGIHAAEQYCEQAIKIDPSYSDAYSQLAWVLWIKTMSGWSSDLQATMQRALSCAEKALSLNPKDYDGLGARGAILVALGNYDATSKIIAEFSRKFPAHSYGLSYQAVLENSLGRHEEALQYAEQAMATNPEHDQWLWLFMGRILFDLERFPEAVETMEQLKALTEYRHGRLLLAASYAASGRTDEARSEIKALGPDWADILPCISLCYRETADVERLVKWAKVAAGTASTADD